MTVSADTATQRPPFDFVLGALPVVTGIALAVLMVIFEMASASLALNVAPAAAPLLTGVAGMILLRRGGAGIGVTIGLGAVVAIETFVVAAPTNFFLRFFALPLY